MEDRLRECPGCNGIKIKTELWGDWFTTACQDCNWQTGFHNDEESAEAAWNTRATDPLLEKMAEALTRIDKWDWNVILQYSECDKEVFDDLKNVEQALKEYREETCQNK